MTWEKKPTLGYPTRTAAALALQKRGLTRPEIAAEIGVSEKRVKAYLTHGKVNTRNGAQLRAVSIPVPTLERLAPEAKRRGVSVVELARRIVAQVALDGLVGAILDDTRQEAAE